jgi:hypothetical protein
MMGAMSAPDQKARDLEIARALAAEVSATGTDVTWRKVTALIDRFGAGRLTPPVRDRVGAALAEAGLSVKPSFATVQRYETVRLALGDAADVDDDGRTRTMSHVLPLDEAVRITEWRQREPVHERGLFDAAPVEGVLSIELDVSHTEPDIAWEALGPLCPGLTEAMVNELFTVDPLPKVRDYPGEIRLVSGFSVRAEESERDTDDGKAGALVFQLVELLAGDGWLVTSWHRSKRHEGAEEIAEGPPLGHADVYDAVARHWVADSLTSADDLATLILHELVATYPQAGRVLMSWLEQWELDFHRRFDETERATLIAIRALLAEFEERLVAFERPEVDPGEAWFTALSSDRWATRIRGLVTRTLADLDALKGTIRSSLDLLGVYSAAQHLRLARQQAEQGERLQQALALVTSVLLVPPFIPSLFGSNTQIPGQGAWWGFGVMLGLIVVGAAGTYLLIRPRGGSG